MKPINKNILVRRDSPQEQIGSVLLPDQAVEPPATGTIVDLDPSILGNLRTGLKVYFPKYVIGNQIDPEDENLIIMKAADILGYDE